MSFPLPTEAVMPALELLDFLERLAPFAPPTLLLRDPEPLARRSTASDQR